MHKIAGTQVSLDGLTREEAVFTPDRLTDLFYRIIDLLKLKPLSPLSFLGAPDQSRMVATCIHSTGHIILHGWAQERYYVLDSYATSDYDWEALIGLIDKAMTTHTSHVEVKLRIKPRLR